MKKCDMLLHAASLMLAIAGLVLIAINIATDGAHLLPVALSCVVVSQLLLLSRYLRRKKD